MVLDRAHQNDFGDSRKDSGQGRPVLDEFAPRQADGLKQVRRGMISLAPEVRAAWARPVISKQLSGSLMGLSVTSTWAAPACRHNPATAASSSGLVVAPREAGEAKAALTLMQYLVALADKSFHPAQGLDPLLDHQGPVLPVDNGHFPRPRGPWPDRQNSPGRSRPAAARPGRDLWSRGRSDPARPRPGPQPRQIPGVSENPGGSCRRVGSIIFFVR